jgi:hypothetical protein
MDTTDRGAWTRWTRKDGVTATVETGARDMATECFTE